MNLKNAWLWKLQQAVGIVLQQKFQAGGTAESGISFSSTNAQTYTIVTSSTCTETAVLYIYMM